MAGVVTSPEKAAALRRATPLLGSVTPYVPQWMVAARGGCVADPSLVVFTSAEAFDYPPALPRSSRRP